MKLQPINKSVELRCLNGYENYPGRDVQVNKRQGMAENNNRKHTMITRVHPTTEMHGTFLFSSMIRLYNDNSYMF